MPSIKVTGLDKLKQKMKKSVTMDDVARVVKTNGSQLQRKAQKNADFKGHYEWQKGAGKVFKKPTGALKGSIGLELKDNCFTAEVEPEKEYAPYVEYGTRFMDAQPYMRPAFNEQKAKFKSDLNKLMK